MVNTLISAYMDVQQARALSPSSSAAPARSGAAARPDTPSCSRGIGAVAARTVAAAGATAVLAARDTLALAAVEREIIDSGGGALAVPGDVGDPAVVERLVAQTLDACGRLDAAFNNAGENAGEGHRPPPSATSRSTTSTVSSGCISKGSSSA